MVACLLLAACSTSSSGGAACDDIACTDAFVARMEPASGSWPDGHYSVTLSADTQSLACSFLLPDDAGALPACSDGKTHPVPYCAAASCPAGTPVATQGISITLPGNPPSVSVAVTRSGTSVASTSFTPQYQLCGCAPNGRTAWGRVTVD